jgi:hypothetical protein
LSSAFAVALTLPANVRFPLRSVRGKLVAALERALYVIEGDVTVEFACG